MVSTDGPLDVEKLAAWEATLAHRAENVRGVISGKQAELAQLEEQLALVRRLREIEAQGPESHAESDGEAPRTGDPGGKVAGSGDGTPEAPIELEAAVEEILRERGNPLHISDIREALLVRGVPIPGRGDDANIIVRLRRLDQRFTRTARGTYALAEWGLEPLSTSRKRRRGKASR
jgi:hypothetical protein